jgi:hypothetical protein
MPDQAIEQGFSRVHRLARARNLPGVQRATSYRTPALKVANTTFARMKDKDTLVLHCPFEQKVLLMEISPEIYFETDHYRDHPVLLIDLARIDDEELSLRLHDAWHFKAPERLKRQAPA